jgi:hypothetical protein
VKEELASFWQVYEIFENILEGVIMTTAAVMSATAFRRFLYSCKIV